MVCAISIPRSHGLLKKLENDLRYWSALSEEPLVLTVDQQFIHELYQVCVDLGDVCPQNIDEIESFDTSRLRWDPAVHPWFPSVAIVG